MSLNGTCLKPGNIAPNGTRKVDFPLAESEPKLLPWKPLVATTIVGFFGS